VISEAAVAEQPGDAAFDDPPVFARLLARLDAFAGDTGGHAALAQPVAQLRDVIGFVGVQLAGPGSSRPASGSGRWNGVDQRLDSVTVMRGGRRHTTSERSPARSDRTWIFEPDLPRSTGIGPVSELPFFARTLAPSSTTHCNRRHRSACVHSVNRRCAVGTVTPKFGGTCRQAQPLVSTNAITVKTARSSTRDIPPPCGRAFASGINGSTSAQNPSGTNRRDNSSTAAGDHVHSSVMIQVRHALTAPPGLDQLAFDRDGWSGRLKTACDRSRVEEVRRCRHWFG